jgi:hypothetical protein
MTALILSRLAALNLPSLRNGTAAGPCGKVATICGGMLMTCAERIPVDRPAQLWVCSRHVARAARSIREQCNQQVCREGKATSTGTSALTLPRRLRARALDAIRLVRAARGVARSEAGGGVTEAAREPACV